MALMSRFQWSDPASWPRDRTSTYVFLAEAFQKIGAWRFGIQWAGDEGISAALFKVSPWRVDGPDETAKRERFNTISTLIVDLMANGTLVSALRTEQGGSPFVHPKVDEWNADHCEEMVTTCCMNKVTVNEFMAESHVHRFWIFVERSSLDALLAGSYLAAPRPDLREALRESYLSPYMELMFDVIREFGIDAEHHSKIDPINDFIEREWLVRGFPDSKKLRESMATMVRDPRAQSGGLNKTKINRVEGVTPKRV